MKGDFLDALIRFIIASQMDRTLWKYHYNCAVVLLTVGNIEEARSHMEKSKGVDPDNPEMNDYYSALLEEISRKSIPYGDKTQTQYLSRVSEVSFLRFKK